MAPTLPSLDVRRLRSYIFRLPLFTRVILVFIAIFWILELQQVWNVIQWGALIPQEINLATSRFRYRVASSIHLTRSTVCTGVTDIRYTTVYRLNTYPLIHRGFLHAFFNTLALVPLLERFESEHGTLLTAAMFGGRRSSLSQSYHVRTAKGGLIALSTLPGAAYLLVERGIFRQNAAILGARYTSSTCWA